MNYLCKQTIKRLATLWGFGRRASLIQIALLLSLGAVLAVSAPVALGEALVAVMRTDIH